MSRGCRRRASRTKWSAITSKPSARRPLVCATGKGCPGSSNRPPSREAEIADGGRDGIGLFYDDDHGGNRLLRVKQDVRHVVAEYYVVRNWVEDVKARVGKRQ